MKNGIKLVAAVALALGLAPNARADNPKDFGNWFLISPATSR